jgi:hypothetical protein
MTLDEALESAHRLAADRGVRLGALLLSEAGKDDCWVLQFDVTDNPPQWAWWVKVTPSGEDQIMVVTPNWEAGQLHR